MQTLQQFNQQIAAYGNEPALVEFTKECAQSWTYERLCQESESLAKGLVAHGLQKGDGVALIANSSAALVIACLAVMRAGGVCVLIDAQFSNKQLMQVLENSKPVYAFVSDKLSKRLSILDLKHLPELILLDDGEADHLHWRALQNKNNQNKHSFSQVTADDIAVIFFTSGTTGAPKGVPLSHRNLLHQLNSIKRLNLITPNDRILQPLPLHHVYPFTIGTLIPLYLGVRIVYPAALTGGQMTRSLKEQRVTVIIGIPRLYRSLVEGIHQKIQSLPLPIRCLLNAAMRLSAFIRRWVHLNLGHILLFPIHRELAPALRIVVCGGAPLSCDVASELETLGWQIACGYGLTETSPIISMIAPGEGHLDTVGKTIDQVSVRIDAVNGQTIGEVVVKGPNVFSGYLNQPDKTKEAFTQDGWFRTGDLGKIDQHGRIVLSGRASTMIVTESGENVQPEDLEIVYEAHPAIKEIGILACKNNLVAVIVPEIQKTTSDSKELVTKAVQEIARDLPSYQRLVSFKVTREALPRTRLGKIRRKELAVVYDELCQEGLSDTKKNKPMSFEKMSGEDQALLIDPGAKQVWDMLTVLYADKYITPDTLLRLELQVDSLKWINLTLEIERATNVELTEEEISNIESIRDLLKCIADKTPEKNGAKEKADFFENPESYITDEARRWIKPLSWPEKLLAHIGFSLNRVLFKSYFRLKVEGELPDFNKHEQYIIVPNHISLLDSPALAAALDNHSLRQMYWAGLKEIVFSNFLMRFMARLAGVFPVNQRSGQSTLAFGAFVLKAKKTLIAFPEGQRSPTGELQSFKPGVGMLAEHFKIPIIPVYITGAREALPIGARFPKAHPIKIRFGKPLDPAQLEAIGVGEKAYERIIDGLYQKMQDTLKNNN